MENFLIAYTYIHTYVSSRQWEGFCIPEVFDMVFELFKLQQVPHGVAVQECVSGGPPVDI